MVENKVQQLYGNFVLIGNAIIPKDKERYVSSGINSSGYSWKKIQFAVDTGDNNIVFLELMGGHHTKQNAIIYSFDKSRNKMEIAWNDRNDKNIIDVVAEHKKYRITLDSSDYKECNTYITEYDMVEHIENNLQKGERIFVQGNFKVERYKDKLGKYQTSMKYTPVTIRLAKDDEVDTADLRLGFVFGQDAWDEGRIISDRKVDVSAYFTMYNKELEKHVFVPLSLVLNCEKIDMSNSMHKSLFNFYKDCFVKGDSKYYETEWHCQIFKGTEQEDITMDDLTASQRQQIELQLVSFDDVVKDMRRGKIDSPVNEIRLIRPTNKFDGNVNNETAYDDEHFVTQEEPVLESKDALFTTGVANVSNTESSVMSLFGR